MQEIVVPTPVKALLAALLVSRWTDSAAQVEALRKGLGLLPSAEDPFWAPIGAATKSMKPKDKIVFLSDVIPLFGTAASAAAIELLPALLPQCVAAVKNKLPEAPDDDVELLATEFIATDFLNSDNATAAGQRLLRYLAVS